MEEQGKVVIDRELLQRMYDLCVMIHRENKSDYVMGRISVFAYFLDVSVSRLEQDLYYWVAEREFDVILPYMELHK